MLGDEIAAEISGWPQTCLVFGKSVIEIYYSDFLYAEIEAQKLVEKVLNDMKLTTGITKALIRPPEVRGEKENVWMWRNRENEKPS